MDNDYLVHYGVLGMKWGVRKKAEKVGNGGLRNGYSSGEITDSLLKRKQSRDNAVQSQRTQIRENTTQLFKPTKPHVGAKNNGNNAGGGGIIDPEQLGITDAPSVKNIPGGAITTGNDEVDKAINELLSDPELKGTLDDIANDPELAELMETVKEKGIESIKDPEVLGKVTKIATDPKFAAKIADLSTNPAMLEFVGEALGIEQEKLTKAINVVKWCRNAVKKGTDFITGVYDRSIDTTKSYIAKGEKFVNGIVGIFKK